MNLQLSKRCSRMMNAFSKNSSTNTNIRRHLATASKRMNGPPIDLKNFDNSIKPSESFYKYVNGTWLSTHEIPSDRSSFNCFVELDDLSKKNLKAIFDELQPGQSLLANLYLSGLDEATIEAAGLSPIEDLLQAIEKIEKVDDVVKVVSQLHREGIANPLFRIDSSNDSRDSKQNALLGGQSGLGLPDRDYYFDESKTKEVDAYVKYISALFVLSGKEVQVADQAAQTVFEFEKSLAAFSLKKEDRRDPVKTYNKISIGTLAETAPSVPWSLYFSNLDISPSNIILENVEYFGKVSELLESSKIPTLKSYLQFHLLNNTAPYLGKKFVDASFDFNGKTMTGAKELQPRWKRVIGFVGDELRDLLAKAYVERHFTPQAKKAAKEMVDYIVDAFRERIKTVDWMQDATRVLALKKLDKFTVKIGYPDKWLDYSPLNGHIKVDAPFLSNIRKATAFNAARELKEYNQPADTAKWHMPPYMVNAYFNPPLNEIVFPAAILTEPFFFQPSEEFPLGQPAMSFGAIGGVISHEISHGYDDQGRKYDADGNLVDWWLPEDGQNFDARAEKIVQQFNKFTVLGKNVNGKLTQGENIADLGGLSVSYAAFQAYIKAKGRDVLPKNGEFTQEQQFFISWSQVWRNLMREETSLQRLITDPHSPAEYRVDGPLMNLPEFHAAFNVKSGDRMYAQESERVSIW